MQLADNTGPDQPAHSRRLIRAFVVRVQNQWILYYLSTNSEWLDQTARMRMRTCTFTVCIWHKGLFPTYVSYVKSFRGLMEAA